MDLIQIDFNGKKLEVTANKHVVVKDICEAIGIEFQRQYKKLKADPTFEAKLLKVQTPGGVQDVFCIPLDKLNGWLFTINPNKTKPEVKEKLILYKKECFRVLYEHFNKPTQPVPAGCPAERFDNRINGYKGQLAQRKKEIESLRWELMLYKSEVESLKSEKRKNYNLQHTVNNLAGSYTRLREEFTGVAESLEYLAKCIKRRIEAVDYFIGELEKVQPESKSVADAAAERAEISRQWIDTNVKGRVKLR